MRILITGATGFLFIIFFQKIIKYDMRIIVRSFNDIISEDKQIILNNEYFNEFKDAIQAFDPEIVLHLATYSTSNDDIFSIRKIIDSNIFFTSLLLECLKKTHIKLFINTGTFAEYYKNDEKLDPAYYYAASKIAARYIIKYFKNMNKFKTVNIIPYTVYGGLSKSKKVIDYIIDSLDSSTQIGMTAGEQILDFIHVDDLCDFYGYCIKNYDKVSDGADYHVGTGKGTSIKELAAMIESKTGKRARIQWGAKEYRELDIMKAVAPLESVRELDWMPKINLDRGLTKLLTERNIIGS